MIHPHKNSLIVSKLILFVHWVHETVNHALLVPEGSFSSQGKGPESGYKLYNQASQNLPFCLMMLRDNLLVS